MRGLLVLWVLLSLAAEALPVAVEQALSQPGPVEILSLDPQPTALKAGPTSGGFSILGRAQLRPSEGPLVCAAVLKGLKEAEQEHEPLPSCFEPRHALRFGELDVVICYSCHRWNAFQRGVEIGGGRITQAGSQECERAVIAHGLDWQGWAELNNRFFHATGFSIALPPYLKVGHRGRDEFLRPEPSMGTVNFHSLRKTDVWFTGGDTFPLDSPIPLAELYERLRRQIPGMRGELDSDANQLEIFGPEDDLLTAILTLLTPEDPESVVFYPSREATVARNCFNEWKANLGLSESSPGVWTAVSQGHFEGVALLEREGSYLVCSAKFKTDEASGRHRWEELLSSIRFQAPIGHPEIRPKH
jgi:hypothetical protein